MASKIKIVILFTIPLVFQVILNAQVKRDDQNWPSFRGKNACGIAEGFKTAANWNVPENKNIKWKTEIPGLGHSSPVIWGDRIYLTTAVSGLEDPEMKVGLCGSIDPVEDETVHKFKVYCLDKNTGKIIWERTSHEGVPKVKRHPKATHANSTPATNGEYVVAFFGSEGLFCYDMDGKLIWKKDFGILDSGFFRVPSAQWGFASSPVIHDDVVVVQCDVQKNSFLVTFDLKTGKQLWRTSRDEVPTWGTPAIYADGDQIQIIVNGYKHTGGYDFKSGKSVWKLVGGGDIPVPTPVIAHGLVFINSAHGSMSPIYAIKLDAKGDISLGSDETSNASVVWSIKRGGGLYADTAYLW